LDRQNSQGSLVPVSVTAQANLQRHSGFTCLLVFLLLGSTTINFIDRQSLSVDGSYSRTCFEKARIQHVLMHLPEWRPASYPGAVDSSVCSKSPAQ
jgi:hypothetical protein